MFARFDIFYWAATHALHRCGLLVQISPEAWSVCLCVCFCVSHMDVLWKKTAELIEMPFEADICRSKKHVLDRGYEPPREGAILGLSGPIKSIWSLCWRVCSRRDQSVLDSGMIARMLQPTAMLPIGRSHITRFVIRCVWIWIVFLELNRFDI